MNTSVRARQDARGFSFIELLVTIIIAGIAFAALVPVFVTASQKGRGDSARNVSLNLAQDRIEKVRELDYDLITESNLQNTFGTSAVMPSGGGSKTYTVAYSVTFVGGTNDGLPVDSTTIDDGSEKYKLVGVDVYWTGNPRPVKHAVLKTIVYKQYTGSYLDSLTTPTASLGSPSREFITTYTIDLTAKVNAADIANTKSVVFRVYGVDGSQLKRLVRYVTDAAYTSTLPSGAGVFTQTYTILETNGLIATDDGSRDGTYTFKAVAVNKNGYEGNTQAITLPVETDVPPVPSGLAAVATNKTVDLTWNKSSAGDVTSYLVYRGTSSSGPYGAPRTVTVALGQVPAFTDTGLSNGTMYYYNVEAVDGLGYTSAACTPISAKPVTPADETPPGNVTVSVSYTDPSKLTAPPPLTLRLVWTGVTDTGSGATGVAKYLIYRRTVSGTFDPTPTFTILANDIAYWNSASNQYTFNDSSGLAPVVTYYYQVKALDGAGNLSLLPAVGDISGSKVTQNYDYCSVTVKNNSTSTWASIIVTNSDGSAIATWPEISNPANSSAFDVPGNGSRTWQLPVGFSFKAGWQLSSASSYTFKPIPASGVISSTTPFTVSFP